MGRNISENHLKAYKEGCFKQLFSAIKEDPELSFEVRSDNEVMVYKESRILSPIQISIIASVLRPNVPNTPIFSVDQPPN